jgi:chemotaxis protein methyltransferase CheR
MTAEDFDFIRKLLLEQSAIALEPGKEYLVETRLAPILRDRKLNSIGDFVAQLRGLDGRELVRLVVEALVTTETSFFRDHHPFESLKKTVIPELIRRRAGARALTIWCAASSTGQEPYSLAMLIREHFPELRSWKVYVLATDLSKNVLARAREGKYNQIEVNRGLPAAFLIKYFEQRGTVWQVNKDIRDLIDFRELNLAQTWPFLPRMDLILNRNVMIYFDVPTKKKILGRIAQLLQPDGYLLLGGAETTFSIDDSFQRVEELKSGFYRLADSTKTK